MVVCHSKVFSSRRLCDQLQLETFSCWFLSSCQILVFGFLFVLLVADRQLSLVGNTEAGKRLLGWIFETTPPPPNPPTPPFPYSANPSIPRALFKLCNHFHPGGLYIYENYFRGHFFRGKTLIADMYDTFTKLIEKYKKVIDRLID